MAARAMMDRSVRFNNAGVQLLEEVGNQAVALDLFRGALECSKNQQEQTIPGRSSPSSSQSPALRTAEDHLQHMGTLLTTSEDTCTHISTEAGSNEAEVATAATPDPEIISSTTPPTTNTIVPEQSRGYQPFLCTKPFILDSHLIQSSELSSGIIIFNVALTHQLAWRNSKKALTFYRIAAGLLLPGNVTDDVTSTSAARTLTEIRVALLNNFGVSCYENGVGGCMVDTIEALTQALDSPDSYDETGLPTCETLDEAVVDGCRRNIQWLLTPPSGGSPAA